MPTLEVLCGMISSGKSTYSTIAATKLGCIICNDDSIVTAVHGGIYKLYDKKLKPLYKAVENTIIAYGLSGGRNVIVDRGVNGSVRSRRRFIGLGHSLDCQVAAIVFPVEAPAVHAQRRFNADSRGLSLEYWQRVAEHHASVYQPPVAEEGWDQIVTVKWEDFCGT